MNSLAPLPLVVVVAGCADAPAPANDDTTAANAVAVEAPEPAANEATTNGVTPPFAETPGAHPYPAPESASIPAKFRGSWAETKARCDPKDSSFLTISGRTIRFPTFVIFGDSVTVSGNQFALKGKIEGTYKPAEAQYFLSADGNTLTDGGGGGAIRVRCA